MPTLEENLEALESGFKKAAQLVRDAPSWEQTQDRMCNGTFPFLLAMQRLRDGLPETDVNKELRLRLSFLGLPDQQFIGFFEKIDREFN